MPASQCIQYEFPKDSRLEENSSNTEHNIPLPGIYSRTKRMKQQQEREQDGSERGIEKAIHRFNAVCQWVSSEIVQTNPIEARVKLIEKFIRLAKVYIHVYTLFYLQTSMFFFRNVKSTVISVH